MEHKEHKDKRPARPGMRKPFRKGGPGGRPPRREAPKGPSARDAALKAFRDVLRENAFAAQALDRTLGAIALSEADTRLAASIFYTALENKLRIEHILMTFMKDRPVPTVMEIMDIAAAQLLFMDKLPDYACVNEAVDQAKREKQEKCVPLINAVLRALTRARDAGEITLPDRKERPEEYLSERFSVSVPIIRRLIADYGFEETEAMLLFKDERRGQNIRPNRMRMTDEEFEKWLDAQGFKWEHARVAGGYRVSDAGRLAAHEGYRSGVFSMQGESAMLAACAVRAKRGGQILDACAAPGGKTCLIAETMQGTGRVYAWDVHEHRAELIRAAARRLELDNIRPSARDAGEPFPSFDNSMDAVLIDAPCSGLGVMDAKPDIRYRLTAEDIDALVPIQERILDTCSRYVKAGGRLVYATCTVFRDENERQIGKFLSRHPEFEPDTDASFLPDGLKEHFRDGCVQILPHRDGLEGFFIACLKKKG